MGVAGMGLGMAK